MVKNIKVTCGKKKKDGNINKRDTPFKKMSIFFKYLPYWSDLAVRHSIDGMHIKKNVNQLYSATGIAPPNFQVLAPPQG